MAKIKKRKSLSVVGDVEYVMNIPMNGYRNDDSWYEEMRLTYLSVALKAIEHGSRHIDVFKAGISALTFSACSVQTALGEEANLTEDDCCEINMFCKVPERLWPILTDKLTEALKNAPMTGPRPRHIVSLRWTAEALEAMKIEAAEEAYYASIEAQEATA